jgi:hypothetical protein
MLRRSARASQELRRLAGNEMQVAASAIGIAPDALWRAVDDGHSISAIAAGEGVSPRDVVDAVVRDATATVERALATGTVARSRARTLRKRLPLWSEHFVLSTPAMLV